MKSKPLIVVVEDEEHLAQGLLYNLTAEGYRTHHEADGDSALAWLLAASDPPAAVLLDVMLPGRDGFSIVRALRAAGRYTPVLLLTARTLPPCCWAMVRTRNRPRPVPLIFTWSVEAAR